MSEHAAATEHPAHTNYVKIWAILCVLLAISVAGPSLHIKVVTLITAFGIAIIKAYLVATRFMHLNIEKRFVVYILGAMITLMLLMFGGVAPDILKHEGARWSNDAAKAVVEKGLHEKPQHEAEER